LHNLKIIKGYLFEAFLSEEAHFTRLYLRLRKTEGRIYNNQQVAALPHVPVSHPYYSEWKKRNYSREKLLRYLRKHRNLSNILEVGCGNGWLTANLSRKTKGTVTGIDINRVEIEQARKVFRNLPNLTFIEGDIRSGILKDSKFDMIVFAASIQYFSSLKEIINVVLSHLTLQGEIHIIDSHFYRPDQLNAAKERSRKYFIDLGFPEMIHFYFHHNINDLTSFRYHFLNNPASWLGKIKGHRSPFHWVVIKN
jgi:ubiquinone/menaquinone biosynthesis C-methylase UbiE